MDQVFMLQGVEEAFYFGIVIAVVFPREAYSQAIRLAIFSPRARAVLAAMV